MKKSISILTLACAGLLGTPAVAHATNHQPTTKTISWFMEGSVHGETTWPQPLYTNQCGWLQVDTYKYATDIERAKVDSLDDDGYLTLVNGSPEDSSVYISHYYKEVPCTTETPKPTGSPTVTPSPTPTTESPTPTPTVTEEPTPTESPSPEPTSSPSVTPSPTSTPTPTVTPTNSPTGTPSPTTSQTVTPVVPSESPTSTGTLRKSTGPGVTPLAETGINTGAYAVGITGLVGLGAYLTYMAASKRRENGNEE